MKSCVETDILKQINIKKRRKKCGQKRIKQRRENDEIEELQGKHDHKHLQKVKETHKTPTSTSDSDITKEKVPCAMNTMKNRQMNSQPKI